MIDNKYRRLKHPNVQSSYLRAIILSLSLHNPFFKMVKILRMTNILLKYHHMIQNDNLLILKLNQLLKLTVEIVLKIHLSFSIIRILKLMMKLIKFLSKDILSTTNILLISASINYLGLELKMNPQRTNLFCSNQAQHNPKFMKVNKTSLLLLN